jgi:hypothetical protein
VKSAAAAAAVGLVAASVLGAPVANADVTPNPEGGCTITGILVILALNGPINICDNTVASPSSSSASLSVPISIPVTPVIHLGARGPRRTPPPPPPDQSDNPPN